MTKDEEQTIKYLKKLNPGFQQFDIFNELARITVLPILEIVPLRLVDNKVVEVLLLKRGREDPVWPNELHTPGTVYRSTDFKKSKEPFDRIMMELDGTEIANLQFVDVILNKSKRGVELAQIFWAEVLNEPKIGEFYNVNRLPKNLMKSQVDFIHKAAKDFLYNKID